MAEQVEIGEFQSPGGFVFGVQGWMWGEPRPKSITFFLDGTAAVCDQHGRPIKGVVVDNKEVFFAIGPPKNDDGPTTRSRLASHQQVIAALNAEMVDWRTLTCAGWPQLNYDQLKELPDLPPTPLEELRKIRDPQLRRDAIRARRECDESRAKELSTADED